MELQVDVKKADDEYRVLDCKEQPIMQCHVHHLLSLKVYHALNTRGICIVKRIGWRYKDTFFCYTFLIFNPLFFMMTPIPKPIKKYFSPSLLVYSKKEALAKLAFVDEHFLHSHLHVDVTDGKFVPSLCWCKPGDFKNLGIQHSFEAHLMTLHPERRVSAWKRAGATRILFHAEATTNPLRVIDTIEKHKIEAGIALNLETSINQIELLLDRLDAILFMGIIPGLTGQPFHKEVIKKIQHFHRRHPKKLIIIDGGVSIDNATALLKAGARQLVSTSAIYGKQFFRSETSQQ